MLEVLHGTDCELSTYIRNHGRWLRVVDRGSGHALWLPASHEVALTKVLTPNCSPAISSRNRHGVRAGRRRRRSTSGQQGADRHPSVTTTLCPQSDPNRHWTDLNRPISVRGRSQMYRFRCRPGLPSARVRRHSWVSASASCAQPMINSGGIRAAPSSRMTSPLSIAFSTIWTTSAANSQGLPIRAG